MGVFLKAQRSDAGEAGTRGIYYSVEGNQRSLKVYSNPTFHQGLDISETIQISTPF